MFNDNEPIGFCKECGKQMVCYKRTDGYFPNNGKQRYVVWSCCPDYLDWQNGKRGFFNLFTIINPYEDHSRDYMGTMDNTHRKFKEIPEA